MQSAVLSPSSGEVLLRILDGEPARKMAEISGHWTTINDSENNIYAVSKENGAEESFRKIFKFTLDFKLEVIFDSNELSTAQ